MKLNETNERVFAPDLLDYDEEEQELIAFLNDAADEAQRQDYEDEHYNSPECNQ